MLKKLHLYQFKNYSSQDFVFEGNVHCFYGPNGVGKTNILDAIYYLCFTKSYTSSYDHQVIQKGKREMSVIGTFEDHQVKCIIRENSKKEISLDEKVYDKFSNHIGLYPAVIISPDDVILINGHSDVRRKFLDVLLAQIDSNYLQHLITYNKQLAQRNAFLKQQKNKNLNSALLQTYNEALIEHGNYIFNKRKEISGRILSKTQNIYSALSADKEKINITYQSILLDQSFKDVLSQNEQKDFIMQRTTQGVHRDDLLFSFDDLPFKQYASQGQRKSLLFALKLASFKILQEALNKKPLLLLDDVFEKVDQQRSDALIETIYALNTQIFITDTEKERVTKAFEKINAPITLLEISEK